MKDQRFPKSDRRGTEVYRVMRKTEPLGSFAAVLNLLGTFICGLNGVLFGMQLQPKLVPIPVWVPAPQQILLEGRAHPQGCK